MLDKLVKEDWEQYRDENFHWHTDNLSTSSQSLKLISVSGYGKRQGGNREAYSLLFCGSMQPIFPQGIYRISHAVLGELELFLVPIGPQADGMGYEAVFT